MSTAAFFRSVLFVHTRKQHLSQALHYADCFFILFYIFQLFLFRIQFFTLLLFFGWSMLYIIVIVNAGIILCINFNVLLSSSPPLLNFQMPNAIVYTYISDVFGST